MSEHEAATQQYKVTASELRQFVERAERLAAEKKDIADQEKEVFAEARGRGYDVKVMKKLIAERKRTREDVSEEEAILQLYREALWSDTPMGALTSGDDGNSVVVPITGYVR